MADKSDSVVKIDLVLDEGFIEERNPNNSKTITYKKCDRKDVDDSLKDKIMELKFELNKKVMEINEKDQEINNLKYELADNINKVRKLSKDICEKDEAIDKANTKINLSNYD